MTEGKQQVLDLIEETPGKTLPVIRTQAQMEPLRDENLNPVISFRSYIQSVEADKGIVVPLTLPIESLQSLQESGTIFDVDASHDPAYGPDKYPDILHCEFKVPVQVDNPEHQRAIEAMRELSPASVPADLSKIAFSVSLPIPAAFWPNIREDGSCEFVWLNPPGSKNTYSHYVLTIKGKDDSEDFESSTDWSDFQDLYKALIERNKRLGLPPHPHVPGSQHPSIKSAELTNKGEQERRPRLCEAIIDLPDTVPHLTGPATLQAHRGLTGGESMWQADRTMMLIRTRPMLGYLDGSRHNNGKVSDDVYAAYQPDEPPPLVNWNDEDGEIKTKVDQFLTGAWNLLPKEGSLAVDWFDLLLIAHIGPNNNWAKRSRDNPSTWVTLPLHSLKQIRTRGELRGWKNTEERKLHQKALEAVLRLKVVWQRANTRGGQSSIGPFPYWQSYPLYQLDAEGQRELQAVTFFPYHWFDNEMGSSDGYAPMVFHAWMPAVLRIDGKKEATKGFARYITGHFWRRASYSGNYTTTIGDFYERSGVPLPSWAKDRPGQCAARLAGYLADLSDANREVAMIAPVELPQPSGRGAGVFERWLNKEIEIRPHPMAPTEVHECLRNLEIKAQQARERQKRVNENADARVLASWKKGQNKRSAAGVELNPPPD